MLWLGGGAVRLEELLWWQGTGASWGKALRGTVSEFHGPSGEELECWEGQKMGLGTFCSSMRCCVHRLARDRRPLFPQPPTSPAALGNSCVTVACASMRAGTVMVMRTVMTSLMNAIAVSWG